jgi:hypothetical protein
MAEPSHAYAYTASRATRALRRNEIDVGTSLLELVLSPNALSRGGTEQSGCERAPNPPAQGTTASSCFHMRLPSSS